jgi:hypothetical protein
MANEKYEGESNLSPALHAENIEGQLIKSVSELEARGMNEDKFMAIKEYHKSIIAGARAFLDTVNQSKGEIWYEKCYRLIVAYETMLMEMNIRYINEHLPETKWDEKRIRQMEKIKEELLNAIPRFDSYHNVHMVVELESLALAIELKIKASTT